MWVEAARCFAFMKNRPPIGLIRTSKTPRLASRVPFFLRSFGLMCAIACVGSAAIGQTRYQITQIPVASGANSAALGLNDKGEVVGYSFQGDDYQAFLFSYANRSMTEVGSLGGKLNAACAINAAGQVTGYTQDQSGNLLAFIFSRSAPIASLGTLDGGSTSEAFGINNRGEVVGDSQSGDQSHRPVLFSNTSVQDLGLGGSNEPDALETAYAINDSDQIVGRHSASNNAFHAFLYSNGNTTDLGTLGGANGEALAINKHGHLVGDSDTTDGATHAFLFDGSLKDLGTLPGYENASYARGINNSGEIVGESDSADQKRAFIYSKGHLVQLDALAQNLNEAGFASLDVAYDINDKGWIVGYGTTVDNLTAAFVAVPERSGGRVAQKVPVPPQVRKQKQLQPQERDQGESVSESDEDDYDVFYSNLSPEGSWIEAGNYGYCFRPHVAEDWRPYRDGHWIWTDRGWYWDSNERFGWATYHYGRWVRIGGTGWCWVPGHQWAPAWVSWRESDEHVGWAPLPPEADVSVNVSISSWSDSYYGIGPGAYSFIRYAHWSAPSYVRYCEPPAQNVQIINRTTNVTNIVNNNTVINNYGPPVQTISAKTRQNIQQVKLAVNPATGPNAAYSQTLKGNQLNVVAPPPVLKPAAKQTPPVQTRLANPVVEKGWQGVKPADAAKLKKTIVQQNPPPKDLPKPTPLPTPQILKKAESVGSPSPPASPAPVPGQKQTPPSPVKPTASPGEKVPMAKATPGGSPQAPAAVKKPVPPNLIGAKPTGTPGASPAVKPAGTPGASPAAGGKPMPPTIPGPQPSQTAQKPSVPGTVPPGLPGGKTTPPSKVGAKQQSTGGKPSPTGPVPGGSPNVPKSTPPNLNPGKASPTPQTKPAATPPSKPGAVPPAQSPPATPISEKKPEAAPTPTPQSPPANVATPKPPPASVPKPTPRVKAPPAAAPKPTPQAKAPAPKPQPQVKAPAPKPQPQAKAPAPKPQPQTKAPAPKPQPQAKAPAPKPPPQAKAPAPKPQPQAKAPALKPPQQKPAVQKNAPGKPKASPTPQKK